MNDTEFIMDYGGHKYQFMSQFDPHKVVNTWFTTIFNIS